MSMKQNPKDKNVMKEQQGSYNELDRFEIIDNVRYDLKPSPVVIHQKFVTELAFDIRNSCRQEGVILVAPLDVYFDEENQFQPDVIFISDENADIIKEARIEGAPDLVIEILSPSTSVNDKIRKKKQYERFGVKEYWIVDPTHFIVDQFMLEKEKFHLKATYGEGDTLSSPLFVCIRIDLTDLFERVR